MTRLGLISTTLLALAMGACDRQASTPQTEATLQSAAPDAPAGVSITDVRVQLPAVPGRPGAAYFTVSTSDAAGLVLAGASVDRAGRAEMHETRNSGGASSMVPVAQVAASPGQPIRFTPGGHHLMLFELDPTLKAGDTTDLTLIFANGDKATAPARVHAGGMEMAH